MRKIIVVAAAAALTVGAAGCTEEITPELVDQAEAAAVDDAEAADEADDAEPDKSDEPGDADATASPYGIGDTVAMGDLEHTLHGARWSTGDDFFGPGDGERWLVLDIELTNTGESSEAVSSLD